MEAQSYWQNFLKNVTASDGKHYLWLRSLSYLEYIGYRKMVKALGHDEVNSGVFHHLSDEIRHSFMLKELAEKNFEHGERSRDFDQSFVDIAESYFQDIDGQVETWVREATGQENPYLCYMLVSYLIEKRAMEVYPRYYSQLEESPAKYVIQKIIKDEKEHLTYFESKIDFMPIVGQFRSSGVWNYENNRFLKFLEDFGDLT